MTLHPTPTISGIQSTIANTWCNNKGGTSCNLFQYICNNQTPHSIFGVFGEETNCKRIPGNGGPQLTSINYLG